MLLAASHFSQGPLGSGKTTHLVKLAGELLPDPTVLILASNHSRQQQLVERLKADCPQAQAQLPVYTYSGWVRNVLFDMWPLAEQLLADSNIGGESVVSPKLASMADSEQLLRQLIHQLKRKDSTAFIAFPGAESALIKQLLRRIRQRAENRLTRQAMRERSEWLHEVCLKETTYIEMQFDRWCYQLRILDASKQLDLFHQLLNTSPVFQQWMQQRVQHLLVDDWDETTPAQQAFVRQFSTLKTLGVTCDPEGGSRRGYLNAFPYDWDKLVEDYSATPVILTREDEWALKASNLLKQWKHSNSAI